MVENIINSKRIRDSAPYRKSMSLTEADMMRAAELERIFNIKFSGEAPFNFSKTISKAIELSFQQIISSENQALGIVQQSLMGTPADQGAIQMRQEQRRQNENRNQSGTGNQSNMPGKTKKYQKHKRGF